MIKLESVHCAVRTVLRLIRSNFAFKELRFKECSISNVPWDMKTKLEVTTTVNVTRVCHRSIVDYVILEHIYAFSHYRASVCVEWLFN